MVRRHESSIHKNSDNYEHVEVVTICQQKAVFDEPVVLGSLLYQLELESLLSFQVLADFVPFQDVKLSYTRLICLIDTLREDKFDHVYFFYILGLDYVSEVVELFQAIVQKNARVTLVSVIFFLIH